MTRIVSTDTILQSGMDIFEGTGWQVEVLDPDSGREHVLAAIPGASGVLTTLDDQVDDEFLDAAGPELKIVANVAVGFNNIDLDACAARGVVVTNTPGVLTDATADLAFALLLAVTRRLGEGEELVRSGRPWKWAMTLLLGSSLQDKTLGIIGAGAIGQAFAKRARAFGMNIIYQQRSAVAPEVAEELGLTRVTFDQLITQSDVISLHCPYTPQTHHLLDDAAFAKMKQGTYLINTARGAVVDEAAMISALESGRLAGAGLDVYEFEPQVPQALRRRTDVVLLPHLGSATVETRSTMSRLACTNVLNVINGDEPLTPVGQ
ncbi:MAG: 2-hydroxyacid dehydrogenase [Brooklawnia sp.]|jgi:glyoxylate reductase